MTEIRITVRAEDYQGLIKFMVASCPGIDVQILAKTEKTYLAVLSGESALLGNLMARSRLGEVFSKN
jgi:hypothetical protein